METQCCMWRYERPHGDGVTIQRSFSGGLRRAPGPGKSMGLDSWTACPALGIVHCGMAQ